MGKNIESYIRYLKTFLNNNKYNFNLSKVDECLYFPLFNYLEKFSFNNRKIIIEKIERNLKHNHSQNANIDSLLLNPLIETNENIPEPFKSKERDFINEHKEDLVHQEVYNKINCISKKKQLSKTEKSIFISFGQFSFTKKDETFIYPLILQQVGIKNTKESFILEFLDSPVINFEAIRETPNISVKTLKIIKDISSEVDNPIIIKKQLNELLLRVFEAFNYTSCNNLNVLNKTNLLLVDKYIKADSIINHTLRSDLMKGNLLKKLFNKSFSESKGYSFSSVDLFSKSYDKLKNILENDISVINKPHNCDISNFLSYIFAVAEKDTKIAYISIDNNHVDNFRSLLDKQRSINQEFVFNDYLGSIEDLNHKIKRLGNNLKADIKSLNESSYLSLNGSEIKRVHKIKASYEEFWQNNNISNEMFFKTAKAADDILLEEFFRFPWTIKIADKCKHSQQFKQWNLLINYIDSYFEYKNKVNANRRVDFKLEHSKYSLDILDEINKYLEKNSNISNFGIGIKSSWRNFIKSISIDGKTPQTREDFLAIESQLKLYNAKTTIVKLWNQLLVNIGFAKLNKDTHVFEKKISSYYQPIKNSVYWFHYIWRPFYETLISSGFYWQRFLTEYMNYYVEYGLIKMLLNGGMRELSKLINFKIESIKNKSYLDSTTEETFNVDLLSFNTYIDSIKRIKSENNDILFNLFKQKRNNINVFNLEEIYTEIITNNVSYDLIIIDDAELLSMQEMLLLAYCKKSIILGDNNFEYSSVLEKFKDYDKIFKALLPDLNPDYFTGSFSLMNIISNFMSYENQFFFLNDLNPIINSLRNDYGKGNLLGFSTLSLPLYACFYDLRSIKVASLYKIIRDSFKDVDTEESTLNIYLNATNKKLISKLKSFLVNDSFHINFSNIIVTSNLLEAKSYSCDYLIILNINEQKSFNKSDLYNLASNTNYQLAYISSKEDDLLISYIKDISNREINMYPKIRDTLYNKNIYALDNVSFKDINVDLLTYNDNPTIFINNIINEKDIETLIPLSLNYDFFIFDKDDLMNLENYIKTFEYNNLNDKYVSFVDNFMDIYEKEKRSLIDVTSEAQPVNQQETLDVEVDNESEDPFSRPYIVTDSEDNKEGKTKKDSFNIEVEDLSAIEDNIVKAEKAIDLESSELNEEFLPTSKFSESLSINTTDLNVDDSDNNLSNLLSFLDNNKMPYYDYRSNGGDVWILDTSRVRKSLEAIKDFGFELSLFLRCEKLPNKINAWKVNS